jgi:5-methyltetrahydropteroyltriglutamate--homocysteine methyltransferase
MRGSPDRIRTTHVGSLCRPAEITELLRAKTLGEPYDDARFSGVLTPAVAEVVKSQVAAGVDVPSDGEFGKSMWTGYITERLGGVEPLRPEPPLTGSPRLVSKDRQDFAEFYEVYNREAGSIWVPTEVRRRHPGESWAMMTPVACTGPITYTGQGAIDRDIANFSAALEGLEVDEAFLPLAAPASVEATIPNHHYASDEDYLQALADALGQEYRRVVDAGLLLQVDDAFIPYNYDRFLTSGVTLEEYRRHCGLRIEAVNEALRGIPEDRVRYHICWGSWAGPHTTDVPLKDIVDLLLQVKAQAYSVEAANPRHEYEWQVWEKVKLPSGKILIPGVVTHSTNVVEHPETVAQRIVRYAEVLGRENVMAGTDCGFSQGWSMPRTHPSVQWAKLRALAEGAEVASGLLWGRSART